MPHMQEMKSALPTRAQARAIDSAGRRPDSARYSLVRALRTSATASWIPLDQLRRQAEDAISEASEHGVPARVSWRTPSVVRKTV